MTGKFDERLIPSKTVLAAGWGAKCCKNGVVAPIWRLREQHIASQRRVERRRAGHMAFKSARSNKVSAVGALTRRCQRCYQRW